MSGTNSPYRNWWRVRREAARWATPIGHTFLETPNHGRLGASEIASSRPLAYYKGRGQKNLRRLDIRHSFIAQGRVISSVNISS
jgi:hypothetical protein